MRKKYGPVSSTRVSEESAFELGVLYTTIKTNIESFAAQEGTSYSFADVATRVARLLESEALREQLRPSQLVPQMREVRNGDRRGRWPRGADAAPSSLSGHSSGRRTLSAEGRENISKAQRERWKKTRSGWSPARRAKYSKMMKERWADPKQGKKLRRTAYQQRGRTMSPEARAKISAGRKAYWAEKKGAA